MRLTPKIKIHQARKILLILSAVVIIFGGGFVAGKLSTGESIQEAIKLKIDRKLPSDKSNLEFSLFWKVWDTLQTSYYDKSKLHDVDMVYGAIKGLVAAVGDPYTVFLKPDENKVIQEDLKGSFEGVGIQIGFRGTKLAVIAPLPGSPAEKAGVKPGDLIIAIKDEAKKIDRSTDGMTLPEAVEIIRGPAKTKVTIALVREGVDKAIIVDMDRESIDVPSVVLNFVGENKDVAQLRVLKFSGETYQEWSDAVAKIIAAPQTKGIIVDVRNNPGGYMQGAIDLSSEFLKAGSVVVVEDASGTKKEFKVERIGKFLDKKVVVLMNKGSASASEIFAGALRDNKKVQLVGDTSFGKGTVQEPIQVNGAGLHITIAKWLTPNGTWVHEKGLEPDNKVEDKDDTTDDEQLLEAIKLLQ